ncbi:phospholipid phosphatase 5 [Condylostylus longicornis]|uniref:phospholipid phosphatase 5 n=1 Tax=Condylostylus longicornis TaxID=2530218 RepID=UPI00244E4229|nr:phospholipid phosphatase 5 [Condylostylus longicornis]
MSNRNGEIMKTSKEPEQPNCFNSFFEIALRIVVFIIFIHLECKPAFKRVILPEELWMYKYPPTADYVPSVFLLPAAFVVPFTVIFINYLINHDRYDFFQANNAVTLSLGLNGVITSLLKIAVGRPRPDFFYRCYPDGNFPTNYSMECTGNTREVNEGRKSFPSGHSSFAFAGFGFVFLYIAAKWNIFNEKGRGNTLGLVTSIVPLIVAGLVAISRTCDYHHHWEDVVIGSFIGMGITYICYRQYYPSLTNTHSGKPYKYFKKVEQCSVVKNNINHNGETKPLINENEKDSKWI